MLIFLLYIFVALAIQYLYNFGNNNALIFFNFVLLFIDSSMQICVFLDSVVLGMYNLCLFYIHYLCLMSYLVKNENQC